MDVQELQLEASQDGTILGVKAKPNAKHNALVGIHNHLLRIAVNAAPEKGKANAAILKLLAKHLGIPRSHIEVLQGQTVSQKKLLIRGLSPLDVRQRLSHADA